MKMTGDITARPSPLKSDASFNPAPGPNVNKPVPTRVLGRPNPSQQGFLVRAAIIYAGLVAYPPWLATIVHPAQPAVERHEENEYGLSPRYDGHERIQVVPARGETPSWTEIKDGGWNWLWAGPKGQDRAAGSVKWPVLILELIVWTIVSIPLYILSGKPDGSWVNFGLACVLVLGGFVLLTNG
jgi:hypothetical protein